MTPRFTFPLMQHFSLYLSLARFNRPIGIWLLLLPCWWGLFLASTIMPDLKLTLLFAIGAAVMRGAGCTINDLIDRKIDAKVERTKNRPLASGKLTIKQAVVFFGLQSLIGLMVLLQLPPQSQLLSLIGLTLLFLYPFMKRITYWPQLILGITFNLGALVGWGAVRPLTLSPFFLYIAGIFWTLAYDTIYALQDTRDDALIGVKSTAIKFGNKTLKMIVFFYMAFILFLTLAGLGLSFPYWIALITVIAQILWQVLTLNPNNPQDCLRKFKSNQWIGVMVCMGIILAKIVQEN